MIALQVSGRHFEIDEKVRAYLEDKIGGLDRVAGRHIAVKGATVVLEQDKSGREGNQFVCEITLEVPGPDLHAKEATMNMYAAIDICEAKLRSQLGRQKDKLTGGKRRGGLFAKLWGRRAVEADGLGVADSAD